MTMVSGDVSRETVRPKRLVLVRHLPFRSTEAALVDGSDVDTKMLIFHCF